MCCATAGASCSTVANPPCPQALACRSWCACRDEILKRLDDASDDVAFYDPSTGNFVRAAMPKVYHLNLVVETTTGAQDDPDAVRHLSRSRVIVNQEGVVRIDPVAERTAPLRLSSDVQPPLSADVPSTPRSTPSLVEPAIAE
jgi:hypothetical protein